MPTNLPPNQARIDDEEWDNRKNWRLGLFYYSHRDSRAWVPKRSTLGRKRMGATPNLAKPQSRKYLAVVMGIFTLLFLVVVLMEKTGFLR